MPVKTTLNIRSKLPISRAIGHDILGRILFDVKGNGSKSLSINVTYLESAYYNLSIYLSGKVVNKRFIKQ